nr:hypothetical protein [Tanacetum cinerariifolium]
MYSGAANGNRTKTQRGVDNVSLRNQRSSKRSPFNGKGLTASTNLFRRSCLSNPKNQLQFNGKLVLALVHATRRLRRYFQAHPVVAKDINSWPLADFIAERPDEEGPSMKVQAEEAILKPWSLFTNGSSCLEGSGAGLILTSLEGEEFTYALRFRKVKTKSGRVEQNHVHKLRHLTKQVLVETLKRKSIEEREILAVAEEEGYCWMTPLVEYLTKGTLLAETKKARAIKIKARRYTMVNDVLYRKLFLEPWLRCVGPTQAKYVVKEINEGSCNMYFGPRSVVAKAIKSGYYWPTMHKDARNIIRKCPSLEAQGKVKFLIVVVDYFTKFGLSREIISDNEKQFIDNPFKDWCKKLNIKERFESVKHPQTNGQVERANRSLGEGIKASLGEDNINWVEEAENDEGLLLKLDILEERRDKSAVREARNKAKMEKYYNAKVRSTSFHPRDLVYHSKEASHAKESEKMGPKLEELYEVVEALGKGAYKLRNESEDVLPRTWNVQDLKKCYL